MNQYLSAGGREGKHYREALELLVKAERGPTEPAVDRAGTAKAEQRLQEPAAARAGSGGTTGSPPGASGIRVGETVVFDGITFVGIPPGEFLMGSTSEYARDDERPLTRVKINKGFYLGKYEVTQVEWQAVMGDNPSMVSGCGRCPVEHGLLGGRAGLHREAQLEGGRGEISAADRGGVGVCGAVGDGRPIPTRGK